MRGTKPHMKTDPDALADLPAPEWMPEDAAAEWDRVMPILTERRILTDADLGSLENYCLAIGSVREMERMLQRDGRVISTETGLKRHPGVGIQADAMTRARLLAAELGLTPVSRSRPAIRDDEDDDDLVA
ncbi:phage terminase small subunit P27 family [Tranquillimonas alkanivorans]|uniref:Phage terminase, small subunit, putative, P27 family n=1 Tax=Tranquillimonas alkanivorans TaxID=441119 RepID=A0A1I5RVM9_9RHOB|nr:phage terminase small subunit P27 family [Tranquillimonas alkanivorans]SFP62622.1 phage terminase, small subunit, putative, P27 family [Tranquillimonas alkanivorans]